MQSPMPSAGCRAPPPRGPIPLTHQRACNPVTPFSPILAAGFTSETPLWQTIAQFFRALFDARIEATDCVVWAAVLLGVTCGLLGSFIVLRRQSLLGDAIGHAVLPGVCLGFALAGTRWTP